MKIHTHKRFTTWFDETLWSKSAINGGLRHGVYDHKKGDKCYTDNITIVSGEQAIIEAEKLNSKLKDPYKW